MTTASRRGSLVARVAVAAVSGGMLWSAAAVSARQQQPVFRATGSAVAVDVSVQDGERAVLGLTADDFELRDNGVPQRVAVASLEHVPLDITLVVDTSGSLVGPVLDQFRRDIQLISGLIRDEDRFRVVPFATRAGDAFGWRSADDRPESMRLPAGGATALYQTLVTVLLRRPELGRRQLVVVMSDGIDNVSLLDAPDVVDVARRADAMMHIVMRDRAPQAPPEAGIPGEMERVPRNTGGTVLRTERPPVPRGWLPYTGSGQQSMLEDAAEATGGRVRHETVSMSMTQAFKTVLDEFRTSYVLWFTPEGVDTGGWHELEVRLRQGGYDVRARRGYQAQGR